MWIVFLGALIVTVIFGLLFGLVVLLPPLRRLGRRSSVAAMLLLYLTGGMVSTLSFAALSRGLAEAEYIVILLGLTNEGAYPEPGLPPAEWQRQWRDPELQPALVGELWLRLIRPPALRQPVCYSGQTVACRLVAEFATHEPSYLGLVNTEAWVTYGVLLGVCVAAALANGVVVYRILTPAAAVPAAAGRPEAREGIV